MVNNFLTGCRVLDLTDEKGSLCARLLADMGAEVTRVEKPGRETLPGVENAGKQPLAIDIEDQSGLNEFKCLIRDIDILVESYPVGYLASLGLDYPVLRAINPRLVIASITPFGQTGPYKDLKSTDLVSSALGGSLYVCGEPGKPPLKPFGPQAYYTACLFAANGILLALHRRHSTNRGQYIDISIQECVAATLDHVLVRYFSEGTVAERTGSLYWNQAFRIFPCRDGYILLSIFHQWETLVAWLDSEGKAGDLKDARWSVEAERRENIRHIIEILENWTHTHNVDELVEQGQLMRFPWAKVASIPQLVDNPHLNQRGFFIEITDPATGQKYKYPGLPFKSTP